MPRIGRFHTTRRRPTSTARPSVAHGGRIPRAGRRLPPRPEAAYRPGTPVAGIRHPAPVA